MIGSIAIELLRHQIIVILRVIWLSEVNVEEETNEQYIYILKKVKLSKWF